MDESTKTDSKIQPFTSKLEGRSSESKENAVVRFCIVEDNRTAQWWQDITQEYLSNISRKE